MKEPMKKSLISVCCFALGCGAASTQEASPPPPVEEPSRAAVDEQDEPAIVKTVQRYIKSGRAGDANAMKRAFYDNATIYSVADGQLEGGPITELYAAVEKIGPAPGLIERVGPVDITANTATVRVELENWAGAQFTDQLTLMKSAGQWRILHKVYVQHADETN